MLYIFLLLAFVLKFVILYNFETVIISDILIFIIVYSFLKTHKNTKLKTVLFLCLIKIPVAYYFLSHNNSLTILHGTLELILCYFLFSAFSEITHSTKIATLCKITLTICFIQTAAATIMVNIWFIPPQITSRMTWIFVYIGVVISVMSAIIVRDVFQLSKKTF